MGKGGWVEGLGKVVLGGGGSADLHRAVVGMCHALLILLVFVITTIPATS